MSLPEDTSLGAVFTALNVPATPWVHPWTPYSHILLLSLVSLLTLNPAPRLAQCLAHGKY